MIVYACMCEQTLECEYVMALEMRVGPTFSLPCDESVRGLPPKRTPLRVHSAHPTVYLLVVCHPYAAFPSLFLIFKGDETGKIWEMVKALLKKKEII